MDHPYGVGKDTDFGHSFNYSVWIPGTVATLCNVPWNSDYRDIVDFDTRAELDGWINRDPATLNTWTFNSLTYAVPGKPIRVDIPFSYVYQFNYLRVTNPNSSSHPSGDNARVFYYFVTDVKYVAPNTTEIMVQLDVWSTFKWFMDFGKCYIERGHVGIANQHAFMNFGQMYLTVPEGLDLGSDHCVIDTYNVPIAGNATWAASHPGCPEVHYMVWATTSIWASSYGTVNDPQMSSATGTLFEGLPNGMEVAIFTSIIELDKAMKTWSSTPWISQGIVSIMAVPPQDWSSFGFSLSWCAGANAYRYANIVGMIPQKEIFLMGGWRATIINALPIRYRHLIKFQTFPYSVVELTTHTGNPLLLKPELIPSEDLRVKMLQHMALPSPRVVIYPDSYNRAVANVGNGNDNVDDQGEFLDVSTGITDFPMFATVNNNYLAFMAANRNSIAYQQQSADWSQQRALAGAQAQYDIGSAGIARDLENARISASTINEQAALLNRTTTLRTTVDMANQIPRALMGDPVGGIAGLLTAGANGMIQQNQTTQSANLNWSAAMGHGLVEAGYRESMRDTNKAYADYAAKGDYSNAIAGINAKVQDAKMIQPTTSGQIGGEAFLLGAYHWTISARVKLLTYNAMCMVGEYWLRYGYAVNRFYTPENLKLMQKFTYWRMKETYIINSIMPESFKQTIRGIFEKGVTVWSHPSYIGVTDLGDNPVATGVQGIV